MELGDLLPKFAIAVAAALPLLLGTVLLFFTRKSKFQPRFLGVLFSGPLPNIQSLENVTSWIFECWRRQYPEERVLKALSRASINFVDVNNGGVLVGNNLAFSSDARKTELASYLSNVVVSVLEPKLSTQEKLNKIANAWLEYPQDYY